MQTNSFIDWTRLPLERGVCATPDVWDDAPPAASPRLTRPRNVRGAQRRAGSTDDRQSDTARREFVNEEKLRILKMLEEGKIGAEQAVNLMDALDRAETRPSDRELKKKWIHIQVEKDGKNTVNVRIPLALLKFGFKFAPHAMRRHEERARRRAERAKLKAERMRDRIERRLKGKLGPDFELDMEDVIGDVSEDVEGAVEEGLHSGLGRFLGKDYDLDLDKILELAQSEDFDGRILDVHDEDEDEHVVIRLE